MVVGCVAGMGTAELLTDLICSPVVDTLDSFAPQRAAGCVAGMAAAKLFSFLMWDNHRHAREWERALLGERCVSCCGHLP